MGDMLEIKGLSKSFGGLQAIRNIDVEIQSGEIVGLIGPNGAGKTTLFNLITGLSLPDAGSILFLNENLVGQKPHQICRRGIGRTFQIVKPFSKITVLENIMVAVSYGEARGPKKMKDIQTEAMKLLEAIGLMHKKEVLATSLTIGERKLMEMTRALATNPKLLLLDEVFAGLNPREKEDLLGLVQRIRDDGVTIFITEHVMKVVMSISDRVIVLHHGEKISEGAPKEVAMDPQVVKAYLGKRFSDARD